MESRRKQGFKKVVTSEDGRRRREETAVQLRKAHREEGLAKRRNMTVSNEEDPEESDLTSPFESNSSHKYQDLMLKLNSSERTVQIEGVRQFRRLLSVESNPPVQDCIDCGAIGYFVNFLKCHDNTEIQFEAAWALTNIASTDKTSVVVDNGAVPLMVQLLTSSNPDVREQCAWCLGNIAGDCAKFRDIILGYGGLTPLLQNISMPHSVALLRNCTWTLSNFCRGKPQPKLEVIKPAYQVLGDLLRNCQDQATIIDACWALSYLTDGDNDRIQTALEQNIIPNLHNMLLSNKFQAIVPALRTLGNIVSGNDHQTQAVVQANILPAIVPLLNSSKKNIRKEACWLLSNIAAGNIHQVNSLVSVPDLLPNVLIQASAAAEWDVRKEAAWVISNIATGGSKEHIIRLIEYGALKPLCDLLSVGEIRILLVVMEALESILKVNELTNFNCIQLVDEAEGIEKLELLQEHENVDVYEKAIRIIEKYFGGEEEDEGTENYAPSITNNNTFNFGFAGNEDKNQNMFKGAFNFNQQSQSQQPTSFSFI